MSELISDASTARPQDAELPRWDLTALFPCLESPEFDLAFAALLEKLDGLERTFDLLGVPPAQATIEQPPQDRVEQALQVLDTIEAAFDSMQAYVFGFIATDSRNDLAQARFSELQSHAVALSKAGIRFDAWIGSLDVESLIRESAAIAAYGYPLRKIAANANHLMTPDQEVLAAELGPSAGSAWSRLHSNLTSQIIATLDADGEPRTLTMSELRNMALAPERDLRQRAWETELAAWEANALPLAAALNGVKGQVLALGARRRWPDPLDQSLFHSGIDAEILDAMVSEAREAFPDFRRYLDLKAQAIGVDKLAWFDLFAPVGQTERTWAWPEATAFVTEQFGTFSSRMADLARRAESESWIDAGPRPGKQGGAFCMWLVGDQSRILQNYSPSYDGVSTLAHELGHAYHNFTQAGLTPMRRRTPMILAETASTFCETIVKEAALIDAGRSEQLYILEQSLQGACQIVVDILSRFDFERSVFAARRERELSIGELCDLMLAAEAGTYGSGVDSDLRHPYMWAVKGHYYIPDLSFYNYPYLFGLLFGLGLYAERERSPESFPERYDAMLAATGLANAAELAARFGIDLRDCAFWRSSLDMIRTDIARFEALVTG